MKRIINSSLPRWRQLKPGATLFVNSRFCAAMAAGVTEKPWGVSDIVVMLEQWEIANYKPEYNFVVRQYAIGKGHSVSVLWRGGEVDTIFGFDKEADALEWIKEKSHAWLVEQRRG